MTVWDFVYYIGSGVAFVMGAIGLYNTNENLPKEKQNFGGVVFGAFICAALSWAIPIWWLGFKIYERMGKTIKERK